MGAIEQPMASPFAAALAALPAGGPEAEVYVAASPPAAIWQLQLTRAGRGAMAQACAEHLGVALPLGPTLTTADGLLLAGIGPETWLLVAEGPGRDRAGALAGLAGMSAAVADQDGAYVGLRLSGPRAGELLAKGAFLDFHPAAFRPGDVAATLLAHMNVIIWRLPGAEAFEILVFRSYAQSFWRWLQTAAWDVALARG